MNLNIQYSERWKCYTLGRVCRTRRHSFQAAHHILGKGFTEAGMEFTTRLLGLPGVGPAYATGAERSIPLARLGPEELTLNSAVSFKI